MTKKSRSESVSAGIGSSGDRFFLEIEIAHGRGKNRSVVSTCDLDFFHEVRDLHAILEDEAISEFTHHPGLDGFDADHFDGISELLKDLIESF